MNRRGLIASVGRLALPAVAVAGAGCTEPTDSTGPRTQPQSPEATDAGGGGLTITDFTDVEGQNGNLFVRVTVENRAGEARQGTLVVTARAGDEETTVTENVTVEAGARTEETVETSLSYEKFTQDGSLRVDLT